MVQHLVWIDLAYFLRVTERKRWQGRLSARESTKATAVSSTRRKRGLIVPVELIWNDGCLVA
jgi:hypothetical protein